MVESGIRCTPACRMRAASRSDEGAVHLGELAQRRGGEVDVEREATGAQRLDSLVVAKHHECASAATQHSLETLPQHCPWGHRGKGGAQPRIRGRLVARQHYPLVLADVRLSVG